MIVICEEKRGAGSNCRYSMRNPVRYEPTSPGRLTISLDGPSKARHVALLVETAVAPRRRMLAGVARYVREHEPWAIYLKPYGVEKSLDSWLRAWKGDGIIEAVAELEADVVKDFGIPIVDVVGL